MICIALINGNGLNLRSSNTIKAIDTGNILAVMRKQKQKELIGKINLFAVNTQVSPENTAKLQLLQSQLEELYSEKANGVYIHSRAWWIEKGEKSTSYFFSLEKDKQRKNIISLRLMQFFSRASGLCLNVKKKKSELLLLYSCVEESTESIPVKSEEKYFGLTISKDSNTGELVNTEETIGSMKKSHNHCLKRDLSIMGRILLTKAEGISKLT